MGIARARAWRVALAAAVVIGGLAAPAHAEPSTITGTITAAATGEPVNGCVLVYGPQDRFVEQACTDESGRWTTTAVEAGQGYKLFATATDEFELYESQWSGGAPSIETAAVVRAPGHHDFALEYTREVGDATLSGTITSEGTGAPLRGCVQVGDADGEYIDSTCAGADGTWTVGRLAEGVDYTVWFQINDDVHVSEWANDAPTFATADRIRAPGTVDAALAVGGHLGGTLTGADGRPATWANVYIHSTGDSSEVVAGTWVHEDGSWRVLVRPGEYLVNFRLQAYDQWATGKTSAAEARHFVVAAGGTVQVDDRFLSAARVQGAVTSDATGAPVEGVCVEVLTPADDRDDARRVAGGCTGPDGRYSIEVFGTGPYIAEFSDPEGRYAGEYSGNATVFASAATFSVDRGAPAVVDASLAAGAVITGQAVDARTGVPVAEVCPTAYTGRTGGRAVGSISLCSGPDGQWTLRGVPAGSLAIHLQQQGPDAAYAATWLYKAAAQAKADLVTVKAGEVKQLRRVQLGPGGRVSGRITDHLGQPVEHALVSLDGRYTGMSGNPGTPHFALTDADGRYTIATVPPGSYPVFVQPRESLAPIWSGAASREVDATSVRVRERRTTSYDAVLQPGAQLTGTVLDAHGQTTTEEWLGRIWTTSGDYIGDFDVRDGRPFTSTPLPPGEFVLELTRATDDGMGLTAWYDAATSRADATAVSLERGERREITIHLP